MKTHILNTYELSSKIGQLNIGDKVLLSGIVYTARDAAHKRIFEALDGGAPLPFDLNICKGSKI